MPCQIYFFATKNDLLPILKSVEKTCAIKYVQYGARNVRIRTPATFATAGAIPNLGVASHETTIHSVSYLICRKSEVLKSRIVAGRYLLDQLQNPETITFTPGGIWGSEILLHGRFATASTDSFSTELMKRIRAAIRKKFEKIKVFYVGPEAAEMLDTGKRLAVAAQSPRRLDLART